MPNVFFNHEEAKRLQSITNNLLESVDQALSLGDFSENSVFGRGAPVNTVVGLMRIIVGLSRAQIIDQTACMQETVISDADMALVQGILARERRRAQAPALPALPKP